MPGPKVFVTRRIHPDALDAIASETEMEVWPDDYPPPPATLREKVGDAAGMLTNIMDSIDADVLEGASSIRVISQMAAGTDNIDVAEATRRGIPVGHSPGVLSQSTADHTFALLMATARRVAEGDRWVREGNWKLAFHPMHWLGADISGATIGIVGMGKIGLEVAKRARGFDMKVLYASRSSKPELEASYEMEHAGLPQLLAESDFVTLHVPLTPETHHFIGEGELSAMKGSAILINMARGPVVDPAALYVALKEGRIAGAGLDVTVPEPISPDDLLLTLDNLVITPHVGSASHGARRAMCMLAARNLLAGVKGERLVACFNPEVYGPEAHGRA